jgi:hypothetical protein
MIDKLKEILYQERAGARITTLAGLCILPGTAESRQHEIFRKKFPAGIIEVGLHGLKSIDFNPWDNDDDNTRRKNRRVLRCRFSHIHERAICLMGGRQRRLKPSNQSRGENTFPRFFIFELKYPYKEQCHGGAQELSLVPPRSSR